MVYTSLWNRSAPARFAPNRYFIVTWRWKKFVDTMLSGGRTAKATSPSKDLKAVHIAGSDSTTRTFLVHPPASAGSAAVKSTVSLPTAPFRFDILHFLNVSGKRLNGLF